MRGRLFCEKLEPLIYELCDCHFRKPVVLQTFLPFSQLTGPNVCSCRLDRVILSDQPIFRIPKIWPSKKINPKKFVYSALSINNTSKHVHKMKKFTYVTLLSKGRCNLQILHMMPFDPIFQHVYFFMMVIGTFKCLV